MVNFKRRFGRLPSLSLLLVASALSSCSGSGTIQPDRSVFALDSNYHRHAYPFAIEDTFDRSVKVFQEAGYRLDVIDRATGQISGTRGKTGSQAHTDKGLKFYAMVLPDDFNGSVLSVKVVQIIASGVPGINQSRTELIVSDSSMYRYLFKRIETQAGEEMVE
jgi:hypothetical protein